MLLNQTEVKAGDCVRIWISNLQKEGVKGKLFLEMEWIVLSFFLGAHCILLFKISLVENCSLFFEFWRILLMSASYKQQFLLLGKLFLLLTFYTLMFLK